MADADEAWLRVHQSLAARGCVPFLRASVIFATCVWAMGRVSVRWKR
jgi:hypothetical protein